MQQLLLSIIQRTQRIRRMQTVLCQETFNLWWIHWNKLKIILIMVNIEDVWLTGQTVIMYSITGCSRWLSPIRILATGSLCLPLSLSLSVSATGNRDKSRIWLVHTQLINHYRSSPENKKNGTNISIYPKNYQNYKKDRQPPRPTNWNLSDSALWQSAPGNPSICAAPITTVTVARQVPLVVPLPRSGYKR